MGQAAMGQTESLVALDEPWCGTCPLRQLPSVDPVTKAELGDLQIGGSGPRSAPVGTQLIREGDLESQVYFLFTGWVARSHRLPDGRQLIIQLHLPGDIIGYGSALLGLPAHYSTEALTAISYEVIDREHFVTVFARAPDLARKLALRMARRIRADDYRLLSLGKRKVEERIASLLLSLYAHLSQLQLVKDQTFHFPLSQQHIADVVGTHPVHVNRVLRRLRDIGLVTVHARTVRIHDLDRLRRFGCYCDDLGAALK